MSFDLEVILNRRQETIGQWSKLVAENMTIIIRSKVERKLGYISEFFLTQAGIQRDNWRAEGLYFLLFSVNILAHNFTLVINI